ncbi:Soma ferritin [Pseudolycoriella hygida]|uniref:Ferritin n=1 Tax=Pseudolycoriella hygida TaxID=35572 RepID=A0A9Q0RYH0_9DIPT|nr:Soma ferritin [Pseudolycoriella hygida]
MNSQLRQNFHQDCEEAINKQINMELYASYAYMSMAFYFDRDDLALSGLHKFFKKASDEEREHAMKFMKYQNKRGGKVFLSDIKVPKIEWGSAQDAMQAALDLETEVNESLLQIHRIATEKNDVTLCDFLESEYLQEQVDSMKEIADYVTNLKRVGEGLGVYMFDRQLNEENSS